MKFRLQKKVQKHLMISLFALVSPALFSQVPFTIHPPANGFYYEPLEEVTVEVTQPGNLVIYDAMRNIYFEKNVEEEASFYIGGVLGYHFVVLKDKKGKEIHSQPFKVDCKTKIDDAGNYYSNLLDMLYFTIIRDRAGGGNHLYNGIPRKLFAGWFQDHVHVFKAMKYFTPDIKSGIDLFAEGQRDDGMIYDNYYHPHSDYTNWLNRFGPDFVTEPGDPRVNSCFFVRIPIENMSEFTFLEGVYYVWKATGDHAWMKDKLDNCLKVVKYSTSDPYRWSEKFQLLKRGYTIDIWDFQPTEDTKPWGGDIMMAKPGVTNYSIMYGDNVGFAVGCEYLAEMLDFAGRKAEANKIRETGRGIKKRLDDLSWNGEFYTHHVQEDPSIKRDFGNTDTDRQVTISNAYAINRRIGHEKSVAIIKTYQRIAQEMPESSPGEWYMCYPPYEKGWHNPKWEYMNGGVSSIVAGEVAHGAFEHGFEKYGVHILKRMWELSQETDGRLYCLYKGAMPEKPDRTFKTISLMEIANADISGKGGPGVPGWTGEGGNDLSAFPTGEQTFLDIPFTTIDPEENERKACLIMSGAEGYSMQSVLPLNYTSQSIYVLQAQSRGDYVGDIILNYSDSTSYTNNIIRGRNISEWWMPRNTGAARVAWRGSNEKSIDVGLYVYGFNNPYPEKEIESITFTSTEGNQKWMILGLTLSDYPVFFMPGITSYGAPDNWGAAAVVYALIEGLAGMKDQDVIFNKALIAPRWMATDVQEVKATAKYEASGGYVSYDYKYLPGENKLVIHFTGNASKYQLKVLLPEGKDPTEVRINNIATHFNTSRVEESTYLNVEHNIIGAHTLEVKF